MYKITIFNKVRNKRLHNRMQNLVSDRDFAIAKKNRNRITVVGASEAQKTAWWHKN